MRIPKTVATANFNCHKINIQNHTQIYTYTYVNFNNNYELLMLDFINKQISLMIIAVRVYIYVSYAKNIINQAQEWLNNHRAQHKNQTNNNKTNLLPS